MLTTPTCMRHAELIDGKAIAATIRQETAAEVAALKEKTGKVRRLHVSASYAHMVGRVLASSPDQSSMGRHTGLSSKQCNDGCRSELGILMSCP